MRNRHRSPSSGFTLVELLVAMVVLALIFGLLSQIFNGTVRVTQTSHRQMVATQQARLVLDALRKDLNTLVTQAGEATFLVKADGANIKVAFLTRNRGPEGVADLRFLAVCYELQGSQLVRRWSPMGWGATDFLGSTLAATSASETGTLSGSIARFQMMVVLEDGTTKALSDPGDWRTDQCNGTAIPDGFSMLRVADDPASAGQPRVRSLTFTVAALDEDSLLLPGVANMGATLAPPTGGKTFYDSWNETIGSGALTTFPVRAATALRVVQTTIPLR